MSGPHGKALRYREHRGTVGAPMEAAYIDDTDDWPHDDDKAAFLCPGCSAAVRWPDVLCDSCEHCDACGGTKDRWRPCESCGTGGWR